MAHYQSVFKRYEKKYRINKSQYLLLKKALLPHMTEDEFGLHTICNLYYDTPSYEIIRRSIEKPVYKEKLRLRSYGIPGLQDKIFFELKKKYNKEVFKRRIALSLESFHHYISQGVQPKASPQILSEIQWFMKMYDPTPRIYIAYDRLALFGNEDSKIRVTFDKNIRFRTHDLCLSSGDHGALILPPDECIMEIKVAGALPIWLSDILSRHHILPTSFSKYGVCYKEFLFPDKEINSPFQRAI